MFCWILSLYLKHWSFINKQNICSTKLSERNSRSETFGAKLWNICTRELPQLFALALLTSSVGTARVLCAVSSRPRRSAHLYIFWGPNVVSSEELQGYLPAWGHRKRIGVPVRPECKSICLILYVTTVFLLHQCATILIKRYASYSVWILIQKLMWLTTMPGRGHVLRRKSCRTMIAHSRELLQMFFRRPDINWERSVCLISAEIGEVDPFHLQLETPGVSGYLEAPLV